MENSISSLTYKGSISKAIVEARRQKKLLLVYISGDEDETSINLEKSTWMDSNVADAITKKCIFLHLVHGTVDACNFTAIYPQKSITSISAVGYNGVMLWNNGGYVSAENFVDSIQKAYSSLQLQETAATLLTAALASRKYEFANSGSKDVSTSEVGSSLSSNEDQSHFAGNKPQYSEDGDPPLGVQGCQNRSETNEANSEPLSSTLVDVAASDLGGSSNSNNTQFPSGISYKGMDDQIVHPEFVGQTVRPVQGSKLNEKCCMHAKKDSSEASLSNVTKRIGDSQPSEINEKCKELVAPDTKTSDATISSPHLCTLTTPHSIDMGLSSKSNPDVENAKICHEGLGTMADEVHIGCQNEESDESINGPNLVQSTDIHLNICLSDRTRLQAKFLDVDTLMLVKNFVNENRQSSSGSYDLAVPYPRRVFSEEDMEKSLSDLGFGKREALLVIPHGHATILHQHPSLVNSDDARIASDDKESYFGFLKRLASYFNPFSYFGRTYPSASEQAENQNLREYGSNSRLQNNLASQEASYRPYSPSTEPYPVNDNSFKTRYRQANSSGSNIRTLRDLQDDGLGSDRNTYWNGNSTEFGGDEKK